MSLGIKITLGGLILCIVALTVSLTKQRTQGRTIEELHQHIRTLQGQLATSRQENRDHLQRLTELRKKQEQVRTAGQTQPPSAPLEEQDVAGLRRRGVLHQTEVAGLRQQIEAAQKALAQSQQQEAQAQQALATLKAELQAARQHKIQATGAQQEALATLHAEVEATRATLETTRQNERHMQQTLTTLQQQLQAAQTESSQWLERHEGRAQALQNVQKQLQKALAEVERAQQRQQELTQRYTQETAHLQSSYEEAIQRLKDDVHQKDVTIRRIADRLSIQVLGKVLFNVGDIALRRESLTTLDKIAGILQNMPNRHIRVVGHTDNVPIHASFRERWPTNWELSAARAAVVIRYLTRKGIVPRSGCRLAAIPIISQWRPTTPTRDGHKTDASKFQYYPLSRPGSARQGERLI